MRVVMNRDVEIIYVSLESMYFDLLWSVKVKPLRENRELLDQGIPSLVYWQSVLVGYSGSWS